ncbi:non-ribosomal peptide synthetase [Kitasatospora aureofaciens]|uniref:non-ribosomal peptide synthetase n=1 Tax=Kitasatospora aureofaciens TaxID=1894 RepID=UPI00052581BF|nr:non-ribosomal peptide synthetase [Kitasatospora aureofaciens]
MAVGAEKGTYRRPVSPTECWFLVYPPSVPGVIQVFVEGDGAIDPAALTAAVSAAADACPGSRVTRRGMEWVDSGRAPEVRTGVGAGLDRTTFADEPALHVPLMGDGGPTCEVLLLDGEPATVVFRAFHGAMDGKGVLLWAAEVFRALRGEPLRGADSELTETDLLAKVGVPEFDGPTPDLNWPSCLGERPAPGGGFLWRRRTVDGSHSALVAKIATVVTDGSALDTGRIMVPVDLRRHLPDVRTTGNLVHNPLLEVTAGRPWEEAHERLLRTLAAGGDLAARAEPSLPSAPLDVLEQQITALDAYSAKAGRYAALATVSHMGRLDLTEFTAPGFHPTTVYALPNSGPVGPPEVDVCEVGGRTEITLGWYDGPGVADRAEELLDRIEEALSPRAHRHWEGNRTDRPVEVARSVVHRFAEQVSRTPDAVALTGPEGEVSYRELDARSTAVAAELRRRGIGRESLVGLLADRTPDAVASIWGVLKAGAAYLPLDPHHPDARLAGVLADAGSTLCLTDRRHAGRDCLPEGCEGLVPGDLPPHDGPLPRPADGPAPEDLAYVIYTSGSTGTPKGVEIEHGALTTFTDWALRVYGVDAGTRFPLFTSLAFDLSNTALFLPLLVGGSIALVPGELNHVVLREVLEESGCNAIKLTPTHLDLIGRLGIEPAGFKAVIAGGELLRGSVAAAAQRAFGPQCGIFNEYGPTETTVGCMTRRFGRDGDAEAASVPIGVPTDNTRIHLLDEERRFVEPGAIGEMYLAGDQLARGYRGRPDLTRERFVTLADGTRAYRTGDLARLLPSGELESCGRNDEQVKVRGHRVEPAEIARVLERHPDVERAVVVDRRREAGADGLLCGYVVTRPATTPEEPTAFAARLLPPYMVPAAVVAVPDIPLTVNGKADVSRLPDPFADGAAQAPPAAEPDPEQAAVAGIWARVLDVDPASIGPDTDFHLLGGTSFTLVAMLAAVCAEIVGTAGEQRFMGRLDEVLRRPTPAWIAALAREAAEQG